MRLTGELHYCDYRAINPMERPMSPTLSSALAAIEEAAGQFRLPAPKLAPHDVSIRRERGARRTNNTANMNAAVERWIAEAQDNPNGVELLGDRASDINDAIIAGHRGTLPTKFLGISAFDIADARERLSAAAVKLAEARWSASVTDVAIAASGEVAGAWLPAETMAAA
jgi:hypothetical protein